jgi:hypothetical protein
VPVQHAGTPRTAALYSPTVALTVAQWAPHAPWLAYGGAAGWLHLRLVPL